MDENQNVVSDPNLKAVINTKLGRDVGADIPKTDMESLSGTLSATDKEIASLEGLQYATNLTTIYLGKNKIVDVSPLSNLIKLQFLHLNNNKIVNVKPLSSLSGLTWLNLSSNSIEDISSLSNLDLWLLELGGNKLTDVSAAANMSSLTLLNANNNLLEDISYIKDFNLSKDFSSLSLAGNKISNFSTIKNFIQHLMDVANDPVQMQKQTIEFTTINALKGQDVSIRLDDKLLDRKGNVPNINLATIKPDNCRYENGLIIVPNIQSDTEVQFEFFTEDNDLSEEYRFSGRVTLKIKVSGTRGMFIL